MRKLILTVFTVFFFLTSVAQNITGQWNGVLKIQAIQLRVVFNINKTETGYSATMDSPDQAAKGIPVTTVSFQDSILKLSIVNAAIDYEGKLKDELTIVGDFKQAGKSFPLNLFKGEIEEKKLVRPQEPTKPYPYYSEDVTFENKSANVSLAGTLTLPKKEGVFPVVVLISGSGPQNRDEELLGHKPFLVLSDYLTRNGIAVLRYDDRGTAASTGDFKAATTADFSTDVEAAVAYLETRKEINKKKIGLIGHSEGGIIAPIVAAQSKDVAFIVLLAGLGISGDELLLLQQQLIGKVSGQSDEDLKETEAINKGAFDIVKKSTNSEQLRIDLTTYLMQDSSLLKLELATREELLKAQLDRLTSPWMQYFLKYNPTSTLEKVKCPVLAINGSKDLQVPAKINLDAIKSALIKGGNKNVTVKELPNLNHLFQECKTGLPSEYSTIEQTFSPIALTEIVNWIKTQTK
ncbi:MAG: alpha/beta fold hydrolase [Bacteroidia bacterium]